jgi:hypothetical protein
MDRALMGRNSVCGGQGMMKARGVEVYKKVKRRSYFVRYL